MLFNSFEFIFAFLPLVIGLYYIIPNHRLRLIMLLSASYFFYGYWNYKFVALLAFSTAMDFTLGLLIHDAQDAVKKKRLMVLSVIMNLSILGFFKYFNFFIDNFYELTTLLTGDSTRNLYLEIILPVGISFYTFQSLSYTLDVYFGTTKPHRDFFAFATYVAFFPQLVAGPIVRHSDLVYQLEEPERGRFNSDNFARGLMLFVLGLSKKMILADRLAEAIDPALTNVAHLSTVEAWLCIFGYTLQLYFDFSGYSDMAIGLGRMMNFEFPQNFNSPYKSRSITQFWQRWHMTLSAWLRDYLYIPLGGNRGGTWKTYRNLFLTMFLGGLWHGAAWVYIVWGSYHGILLGIERALNRSKGYFNSAALSVALTFLLAMIGWVFFRSPTMAFAGDWLERMFLPPYDFTLFHFVAKVRDRFFTALIVGLYIVFAVKNTGELNFDTLFKKRIAVAMALLLMVSITFFSKNSPFLYFQF